MEIEKQNGAERPAAFVPPPVVKKPPNAELDAKVLGAIGKGKHFTAAIATHVGVDVDDIRVVDNSLRRLKSQGKIQFFGQGPGMGWRKVEAVPVSTKKVTKKRVKKLAPKKATRGSKKRHHVHCVLPQDLYRHVTTKAKDKTFTQALIDALTKVYGRP